MTLSLEVSKKIPQSGESVSKSSAILMDDPGSQVSSIRVRMLAHFQTY